MSQLSLFLDVLGQLTPVPGITSQDRAGRLPAHVVQQLLEVQLHGGKGAVIAVPGNQGDGLLAAVQLVVVGVKAVDDGLQGGVNPE